jgi:spore germination protein GerM
MTWPGGGATFPLLLCALLFLACGGEPETEEPTPEPPAELETNAAGLAGTVENTERVDVPDAGLEIADAPGLEPTTLPQGAARPPEEPAPQGGFLAPENQKRILLFFPSASGSRAIPEQRIIFLTDTLTSQVKQTVSELFAGPITEGLLPPFPPGTSLEGVFLPGTGVAIIDLGQDVLALPSGSEWEQLALYSLVNTVVHNFAEIHQVQILVQGQEVPTLAGHLDTLRPLRADTHRVDWPFQRLLDDNGDFLPYDMGPTLPEGWVPPPPLPEPEAPLWTPIPPQANDPDDEEPQQSEPLLGELHRP